MDNIPRRSQVEKMTGTERKIREAIDLVEALGADPLLTECQVLLGEAFEKLADYNDKK